MKNNSRDSYVEMFKYFNNRAFSKKNLCDWMKQEIDFFYDQSAYVEIEKGWRQIKEDLDKGNEIKIRDNQKKKILDDIYRPAKLNVSGSHDGNKEACQKIGEITGLYKNNSYFKSKKYNNKYANNYIGAHIWGYTKNPILFNAPWNVVYLPPIVDNILGHNYKTDILNDDLQELLIKAFKETKFYENIIPYVDEYNQIILPKYGKQVIDNINKLKVNNPKNSKTYSAYIKCWKKLDDSNLFTC